MMPKQGTIGWLDFSPTRGHEQSGRRPALIVSSDEFNETRGGFVWVIPITNTVRGMDKISVPEGLPISGVFILSQIKSVDLGSRRFDPICQIPDEFLDGEILGRLIAVFTG